MVRLAVGRGVRAREQKRRDQTVLGPGSHQFYYFRYGRPVVRLYRLLIGGVEVKYNGVIKKGKDCGIRRSGQLAAILVHSAHALLVQFSWLFDKAAIQCPATLQTNKTLSSVFDLTSTVNCGVHQSFPFSVLLRFCSPMCQSSCITVHVKNVYINMRVFAFITQGNELAAASPVSPFPLFLLVFVHGESVKLGNVPDSFRTWSSAKSARILAHNPLS